MKYLLRCLVLVSFMACTTEPRPINYGEDVCYYCKMNIVDRQHAAEAVTHKGRVYTFDAIECMMNYVNRHGPQQGAVVSLEIPGVVVSLEIPGIVVLLEIPRFPDFS